MSPCGVNGCEPYLHRFACLLVLKPFFFFFYGLWLIYIGMCVCDKEAHKLRLRAFLYEVSS